MKKVGIYGGTFSPPHLGHAGAVKAFSEKLSLDKILIIPDFLPPHKELDGQSSTDDRINMCRLAFLGIEGVEISELEIKRGGRSYTAVTLQELAAPDTELCFLMGTDMFLTLRSWYMPEVIFRLATICLVRRENELSEKISAAALGYIRDFEAKIVFIDAPVREISSSEIREAIKAGRDTSHLLSPEVSDYIQKKGLYQ